MSSVKGSPTLCVFWFAGRRPPGGDTPGLFFPFCSVFLFVFISVCISGLISFSCCRHALLTRYLSPFLSIGLSCSLRVFLLVSLRICMYFCACDPVCVHACLRFLVFISDSVSPFFCFVCLRVKLSSSFCSTANVCLN